MEPEPEYRAGDRPTSAWAFTSHVGVSYELTSPLDNELDEQLVGLFERLYSKAFISDNSSYRSLLC